MLMDINILNDSTAENIVDANIIKNDPIATTTFNNLNGINSIDYMTLEIMANSDTYNKYLKRNHLDHDSVLKKEKKFYRKRIISMTKDILFNGVSKNDKQETSDKSNSSSKIDDVIINAFILITTSSNVSPLKVCSPLVSPLLNSIAPFACHLSPENLLEKDT